MQTKFFITATLVLLLMSCAATNKTFYPPPPPLQYDKKLPQSENVVEDEEEVASQMIKESAEEVDPIITVSQIKENESIIIIKVILKDDASTVLFGNENGQIYNSSLSIPEQQLLGAKSYYICHVVTPGKYYLFQEAMEVDINSNGIPAGMIHHNTYQNKTIEHWRRSNNLPVYKSQNQNKKTYDTKFVRKNMVSFKVPEGLGKLVIIGTMHVSLKETKESINGEIMKNVWTFSIERNFNDILNLVSDIFKEYPSFKEKYSKLVNLPELTVERK